MDAQERLRPYVPGFVVDWLRERPEVRHRSVDGSLVFVDVSGFTSLTERLADRGKVGAEEMTALLDATFAELLSVAYSYGAWLVKWGGDAVLLLFQGEAHAERACTAALGMRRTMGRVGRLRTSVGPVRLRVSMGVHSGAFDFFLVGSSHRELVITGPGATVTAECEAAAAAGQVAVSPATAALLPERLLERLGDVVLLARSPRAPSSTVLRPVDTAGVDLRTCLPEVTWQHLLTADDDAEHRLVSVAFVQFSGVDVLLAEQGPGAATAAVDTVVRACQEAAVRHGVTFWETDINRDGGKVMLVGGVPASTGADEDAMLAVARDVVEVDGPLRVRVGVNAGRVFFGQFGPPFRRTMSIKGDAVNLAARVMGKAAQGEVLAPTAVLARSRTPFAVEALPPFRVKGKTHPVTAVRIGPPRAAESGVPDDALPLVGRDRELRLLAAEWRLAEHGRLRVVDVVGEAGTGKSRLVRELCRTTGARLVALRCDAYTATAAHVALRRALRDLLGIRHDAPPAEAGTALTACLARRAPELQPWAPLLAAVVDAAVPDTPEVRALDERFLVRRQEEAVADLLRVLLPGPTLVVVDDAHLLDPSTAQLLERLPDRVPATPWLLLRCGRDGGTAPDRPAGDLRLDLDPLSRSAALELLHAVTDDAPLAPHEERAVVDRSGGNPLFLAELAASARRGGSIDDLPDSVEGVVTARIDRLAPPDRTLLRAAAVVGRHVEVPVLEALAARAGMGLDRAALARLDGFLEPAGARAWRFRHALVRETAYEGLPYSRRVLLHGHLGDVLVERGETDPAVLSLHFLRAQRHAEAWEHARAAAARSAAAQAHAEAAELYDRSLTAARHLPPGSVRTAEVAEALGEARTRLGEFNGALQAYALARRAAADDPLHLARLRHRSAVAAERTGDYRAALRWLTATRSLLDGLPSGPTTLRLAAELEALRAGIRHWQGRERLAVRHCREAISTAQRAGADDVVADALVWLDLSLSSAGEGDGTEAEQALAIWRRLGDRPWHEGRCLNVLGIRAYYAGRWDEARRRYAECRAALARAGDAWAASVVQGNEAEVLADQGHLADAEPLLLDAVRVWRSSGATSYIAFGLSQQGRLAARQGRYAEALEALAAARRHYVDDGEVPEVVETDARTAECLLLAGRAAEALAQADEALTTAGALPGLAAQVPMLHRVRGLAMAALGRAAEADAALTLSLSVARARSADHEVALTLHATATVLRATGRAVPAEVEAECTGLLERLGIAVVFEPTLVRPAALLVPAPRRPPTPAAERT